MHCLRFPERIRIPLIVLLASAIVAASLSGMVWAQAKPFLADRHGAKGLNCQGCHKESPPGKAAPSAVCLGCHGDAEKLAMKTAGVRPNPHDTHLGEMACEECHRAHKPSIDACAKCHHFGLKVP
ncbi:MAG: Fumarate reductase flavoprotein subunit precursor [Syntrophaceae bacterium PtaB.Bin095]|jgi:fumarate reductase flavoprotein subunit|nr:MAG: Fumarate reductase flavoprotein subunit precursor [Syntrophaceae bacterium PtaB.Bin095]